MLNPVCGIAGVMRFDGNEVDRSEFFRMMLLMRHRGPDDEGSVLLEISTGRYEERGGPDTPLELNLPDLRSASSIKPNVILGNRRLSIIDLSPKGHQPMCNQDRTIWVVFNGEVYNYRELKDELKQIGHRFVSDSDTEVIVHGYEEWGMVPLLSKMIGMWGIALWDGKSQKLYLARDRFGIKPLYYHMDGGQLIFGSEIKSIRAIFDAKINENRISEFLWAKPYRADETFFEGINQVMASNYIEIDLKSASTRMVPYWELGEINRTYQEINYQNATKEFLMQFERSIKLHMRSDAPVGTCLSGGLDSSSIVCLAQKLLDEGALPEKGLHDIKKIKTFSSAPKEDRISETPYIDEVVKQSGVEPFFTSPTFEEFFSDVDKVVLAHDEPFQNPSVYMQYRVIKLAKENGIKVLLDGQGGDECLAGYQRYILYYLRDLWHQGYYLKAMSELFGTLYLTSPFATQYIRRKLGISKRRFKGVVKTPLPAVRQPEYPLGTLADHLRYDLLAGSIIELLKYEDTNSMNFSIESRVPFLCHPMIEYLFKLPMSAKIHDGRTKFLLRNAMKDILPEKVRLRRSKLGFPAPEEEWAKDLIIQKMPWCRETVKNAEAYIDLDAFEELCFSLRGKGRTEDIQLFWRILLLSKWLENVKRLAITN